MTDEQMDELMTVAVNMQRDAETDCNRPSAMFAYAVQVAILELRKVRNDAATLAAENAGLNAFVNALLSIAWQGGSADGAEIQDLALKHGLLRQEVYSADEHETLVDDPGNFEDGDPVYFRVETPATDAFLDEVLAQARNEGINYAAGRLAAAFNHGFVDKPLAEVCDVVRMILDTKEELANSTLSAADGLSGEYAEEFIENSIVELRKGAQS